MNCPFCKKIAKNDVLVESTDGDVVSFEPLNPVTPGHRLFVSRKHVSSASEIPVLTGILFSMAARHGRGTREHFNLIINSGEHASQSVPHLHVHYVPRREDDGLKLPWTGQPKVGCSCSPREAGVDADMNVICLECGAMLDRAPVNNLTIEVGR